MGSWRRVATPLGLYKEGETPPFSHHLIAFSLSLSPTSSGPPLFGVCTWLGVLHQKQVVALPESGSKSVFFPLLAWFGAWREHWLHCTCVISSRHYTCGATSSPEVHRESPSPMVFYTTGRS